MENLRLNAELLWRPIARGDETIVQALIFEALQEFNLTPDPEGVDADIINWSNDYLGEGCAFWVLEQQVENQTRLVGSVAIFKVDDENCELRKMFFTPAIRGRGLARQTLQWIINWAKVQGYKTMSLETASNMKAAIGLYQKFGFVKSTCSNKVERCDIVMSLDLLTAPTVQQSLGKEHEE